MQTQSEAGADGIADLWITTQTNDTGTFTLTNSEASHSVRVLVSYVDGSGVREQIASIATEPVANVNDAPVPQVIGPAEPLVGNVMRVTEQFTAADGAAEAIENLDVTYRWQQGTEAAGFTDISGATAETFAVTDAQAGLQVRLIISYTDDKGTAEEATSEPSAVVNPGGVS